MWAVVTGLGVCPGATGILDVGGVTVYGNALRRNENGRNSQDARTFSGISPAGRPV